MPNNNFHAILAIHSNAWLFTCMSSILVMFLLVTCAKRDVPEISEISEFEVRAEAPIENTAIDSWVRQGGVQYRIHVIILSYDYSMVTAFIEQHYVSPLLDPNHNSREMNCYRCIPCHKYTIIGWYFLMNTPLLWHMCLQSLTGQYVTYIHFSENGMGQNRKVYQW